MQVIPAVDVLGGQVVRLLRGSYDEVTIYGQDPAAFAYRFIEQGASMVHVVDLEGARSGHPDPILWEKMAAAGVSFQVGGGVRDAATARLALGTGASAVVMGTAAVWDPHVLEAVGAPDRVIAALDVQRGQATGSGWIDEGKPLDEVLASLESLGITRALVTSIVRDGTMAGPDLSLVATVREASPNLKITASGGVGELSDLTALAGAGCEAVVVGRAIYEKRFTLEEAIATAG
jgi:phosphoribosylformimino-5-aminoimidazole carboxamide ribotide isomerase